MDEEKFDRLQNWEIRWGQEQGLSREQVDVYAKPEFTWKQMSEIAWGFISGLTIEQVSVYADPEFSWEQMRAIREGLLSGISMEMILLVCDKGLSPCMMNCLCERIKFGIPAEGIMRLKKPLSTEDARAMRGLFDNPIEDIGLTPVEKHELKLAVYNDLTDEQLSFLTDPYLDWEALREARLGFEHGLSIEQVKTYADPELTGREMADIRHKLEASLQKDA